MARVIKLGELNQARLMDAIANAPTLMVGQFAWTITDVIDSRDAALPFVFGHLSKFSETGTLKVVQARQQREAIAANLLQASAPFVYLPAYSGLAFLHVWNGIEADVFPRRFKTIIEAAYDGFFVDCTIEPLADYRAFLVKLRSLDRIVELSAKVHPPNPLFGRLWGGLKRYVEQRKAEELSVRETSAPGRALSTSLLDLLDGILKDPGYEPPFEPAITDAAMLMAADGYGSGKAVGVEGEQEVTIRTSESQMSFLFDKEPDPSVFAAVARARFERASRDRDMRH